MGSRKKYHPASNMFPLLQADEYEALKHDIAEHGQLEPIWLHPDGTILDGRNRYQACIDLGIEPQFETWNSNGSPLSFVVSLNLHRRHLDTSQRAMIGLEVQETLQAEIAIEANEKRSRTQLDNWRGPDISNTGGVLVNNDKQSSEPERDARTEAAITVNVSAGTMAKAKQVKDHSEELAEEVASGKTSLAKASRQVKKEQKKETPPIPSDKYRIWYADPPWHYGNSGVIGDDNYGRAERHYPTMTIDELCALGPQIKENCESNAVLFLWVTSPLLAECFAVIKAWGFKYKTSFVWDKVKHNFGHYNSVRHELLLICTRGSCTPDDKTLHDSVISIERSNVHSHKPDEFRRLIDSMYTSGKRIELFSREGTQGWDRWGNE